MALWPPSLPVLFKRASWDIDHALLRYKALVPLLSIYQHWQPGSGWKNDHAGPGRSSTVESGPGTWKCTRQQNRGGEKMLHRYMTCRYEYLLYIYISNFSLATVYIGSSTILERSKSTIDACKWLNRYCRWYKKSNLNYWKNTSNENDGRSNDKCHKLDKEGHTFIWSKIQYSYSYLRFERWA